MSFHLSLLEVCDLIIPVAQSYWILHLFMSSVNFVLVHNLLITFNLATVVSMTGINW